MSSLSKDQSARLLNIDALRLFAGLMVVFLHVSASGWYAVPVDSTDWKIINFYNSAVRSCVPLFFMISGYVFFSKNTLSISKLLKNNVFRLFVIYLAWSVLYGVDKLGFEVLFASGGMTALAKAVIDSHYHLWFLPVLIGLYCLFPVLHPLAKSENRQILFYACMLFFLFGVVVQTLLLYPYQTHYIPTALHKISYELVGCSGYALWGYYLSTKDFSKLRGCYLVLLLVAIVASATKINEMYSVHYGKAADLLYGDMSLPVFAEAVLLFIIFSRLRVFFSACSPQLAKVIVLAAKCVLTIYLLHPFVLEHLYQYQWLSISTLVSNTWLSIQLLSLGIFICCLLVGMILNKIPFVNKWLV